MRVLYTILKDFTVSEAERSPLLDAIPSHAQARIAKFRRIEDQNRSLLGWSLLVRWMVLQDRWKLLKNAIEVGTHGKPGFKATSDKDWTNAVGFNIAHDDELVVCAVHDDKLCMGESNAPRPLVGVDCMRIDRPYDELVELDDVLMDQLTVGERAAVPQLSDPSRPGDGSRSDLRTRLDHLLTLWTMKEAYIKALGHGLNLDLKRIDISFSSANVESVTEDESTRPAVSEARCHLCQGTVRLVVDGLDIQRNRTNGLRWHMQLGNKRIDRQDVEFGFQEYVWAGVWGTAADKGCGMEEIMGTPQRDLQRFTK